MEAIRTTSFGNYQANFENNLAAQAQESYRAVYKNLNIPPVPLALLQDLERPCPIHYRKLVKDTHGIAYINPDTTLARLEQLASSLKQEGYSSFKFDAWDEYMMCFKDRLCSKSGWVLYTKGIIPGGLETQYKSYAELEGLLALGNYEMAEPAVVGAIILMDLIKTDGEYLCDENSFTMCKHLPHPEWKSEERVAMALLYNEVSEDEIDLVVDSYRDFDFGYENVGIMGVRWY